VIDKEGYRANVGIVVINDANQILFAKRKNEDAWQLPQGGIDAGEKDIDALFRELEEEIGLQKYDVDVIAKTPKWLRYTLPQTHLKSTSKFIGQKQVWFLTKIACDESKITLDKHTEIEFDDWKWVDYWQPVFEVVDFKKSIYEDMLKIFASVVFANEYTIPKNLSRPLSKSAILL
jgi:putative (di)nucleoside polyphosphate hydrolase